LHSFRRDYRWKSDREAELNRVTKERKAAERAVKAVERAESEVERKAAVALRKEEQKLQRQVKKAAERKPWLEMIHSSGEELTFYSQEEAEANGYKMKYITQLKAGKLLRYKGYRIKKL
jgi:hypothetical protein